MLTSKFLRLAVVIASCLGGAGCLGGPSRFSVLGQVPAQTLSQQLIAEGVGPLARAASERGDPVRGAILFAQKKLNCAGCHAPGATDLLGPDLSLARPNDLPSLSSDEYLVESLLKPSASIREEYQTTKILTVDGKVIVGRVLDDSGEELVIRDTSPTSRLVRLNKGDVESKEPNDSSAMPKDLADQLTDRQQFLDLIKYLMDLRDSGVEGGIQRVTHARQVSPRLRGLALLDEMNCTSCHEGTTGSAVSRKRAPDLASVGSRVDPEYLKQFITDPAHVKPGTSMPNVMGQVDDEDVDAVADSIVTYLVSMAKNPFSTQVPQQEAAIRGKRLFHQIGCVACHAPRDDEGNEQPIEPSVSLGKLHDKYSLDGLVGFLKDPHAVRPSGRMPNLKLSHFEAVDVASFLISAQDAAKRTGAATGAGSEASMGKRHFQKLGCARCHAVDSAEQESVDLEVVITPLADLRPGEGCLQSEPSSGVRYSLESSQRSDIHVALAELDRPLDAQQQITLTMQTLRCFACHQRDGIGGVTDERDAWFASTNENLGPQGRIPPTLTGVGAKLQSKWMRQVLVSGRSIRPYISTRMPQYGAENVSHLVDLFQRADQAHEVQFGDHADVKEAKKVGTDLVGRGGLNCVACHTFRQKPAETMSAVDLTEMGERLHKSWFYRYMKSPQLLSPGTVMPSFWPGGKAIRKEILDGQPDQQIEAIWLYLQDGRQARVPRGLITKPIELLATDEAVMLRRSYQGIGKRGIGVGYPEQVNLAYDAEQMRLAMIWKGKFADPGSAWRGQGSGSVRPLSREVLRFSPGPELDDAESPWVVDDGRPPNHQFTGYFLDKSRRPSFTYRAGNVNVIDYPIGVKAESTDGPSLLRTLTFETKDPPVGLAFSIASDPNITPQEPGRYLVGKSLRIAVDGPHQGKIVDDGESKRLIVPLKLKAGETKLVIRYDW